MEKVCENCIYAWTKGCIHGWHNSTAMTIFGACGHKKAKKPFTKELYDKLKPHLSDYFPEGSAVPTGIRFDPFVPKNLNDGYDFTDLGYLDVVIFDGTRNFWNAAQKLVAFIPYIVDRV